MSTLQEVVPQPLDEDTERAIQEILSRKVTSAAQITVRLVRIVQRLYGDAALEALRSNMLHEWTQAAAARGETASDTSLRGYCQALEQGCRGSHEWKKLVDTDEMQAYRFTRCLWAEVYRSLQAEDIGFWICAADGPVVRAYNPEIHFMRTKTLMEGDDFCDHVYFTGTPPELSPSAL